MNEMLVSLIHGLHFIRFFDLLVLMCVLYIFKHIFEIIREEMQHRRIKMYAEMKLDTSALDILDNIINEALNEYTIFNMPAKEINYINTILKSDFVRNRLEPMDFNVPKQYISSYPNNQQTIGYSIFKLYELGKDIKY